MMVPEETEDLISKMQTYKQINRDPGSSCGWYNHLSSLSHTVLSLFVSVSVPKVEQINNRLGPLAQEFTDLVYPADYNPEGKPAAKRKTGQGWSLR